MAAVRLDAYYRRGISMNDGTIACALMNNHHDRHIGIFDNGLPGRVGVARDCCGITSALNL